MKVLVIGHLTGQDITRTWRPRAAGAGGLGDDLPAVRGGERVELGPVFLRPGGDRAQPIRTLLSYAGAAVMKPIVPVAAVRHAFRG